MEHSEAWGILYDMLKTMAWSDPKAVALRRVLIRDTKSKSWEEASEKIKCAMTVSL